MSDEKTKEESGVPITCIGCGERDKIKKPFDHVDAGNIFWCGRCGTLLILNEKDLEGIIPMLASGVLKAMTGYSNTNEMIAAQAEKKKGAESENNTEPSMVSAPV